MLQFPRERKRTRPLLLTPLIDVVFLLLLYFMMSTTFTHSAAMSVGVAQDAAFRPVKDEPNAQRIALAAGGALWLNGELMNETALAEKLRSVLADAPGAPVVLMSEANVPVQRLVAIMDVASLSGARQVRLAQWRQSLPNPSDKRGTHGI